MAILTSPVDHPTARSRRATLVTSWLAHPQASFYLVLAPMVLLLSLGMMMVLSASSVFGQVRFGDAFYFVKRQVFFLAVGGAAAYVLAKLDPRKLKILGWLLICAALVFTLRAGSIALSTC